MRFQALRCGLLTLLLLGPLPTPAAAQGAPEKLSLTRDHRGRKVTITAELRLPPGAGKVPAMVIHHGSGGVKPEREGRYAREMVGLGVAALILDSFKGRGVASTVQDQARVSSPEMADDALAALKALADHPRIDARRVGIMGFSKGATSALLAAHESRAERALPPGLRFALHVLLYPWCGSHYFKPKSTGAPLYMLLGAADTYAGVAPCQEYAAALKAERAQVEVVVYPGKAVAALKDYVQRHLIDPR